MTLVMLQCGNRGNQNLHFPMEANLLCRQCPLLICYKLKLVMGSYRLILRIRVFSIQVQQTTDLVVRFIVIHVVNARFLISIAFSIFGWLKVSRSVDFVINYFEFPSYDRNFDTFVWKFRLWSAFIKHDFVAYNISWLENIIFK